MPEPIAMQIVAAPVREQFVRLLRNRILDGTYAPGERLRETELQAAFGVSRTVVREALRQLESESLITLRPNRGPIVTVLSADDIVALYEVRAALEGLAGELFATNASDDDARALIDHFADMERTFLDGDLESRDAAKELFYALLLRGAHNSVLESNLRGIHSRIGIFRSYAFRDESRVAQTMEDLREIVDAAARRREPEEARLTCVHHMREAGRLAVIEYERRAKAAPAKTPSAS